MSPDEAMAIAAAALRWHRARGDRINVAAAKSAAATAFKADWAPVTAEGLDNLVKVSEFANTVRRRERAAAAALARLCQKAIEGKS